MTVTAIALLTLSFGGYGIYFRFGRLGLVVAGALSAYLIVRAVIEGVSTALMRRLLDRLFSKQATSKSDNQRGGPA